MDRMQKDILAFLSRLAEKNPEKHENDNNGNFESPEPDHWQLRKVK